MNKISILLTSLLLTGCPVAMAFDQPTLPECVIDRCEGEVCTVETPEGSVEIPKKRHYEEGTPVVCPLWLIDPR
jgi:hypothetical protein